MNLESPSVDKPIEHNPPTTTSYIVDYFFRTFVGILYTTFKFVQIPFHFFIYFFFLEKKKFKVPFFFLKK